MKASPFEYVCVQSTTEALGLLAQHRDNALVLAGGQSLMPVLNMRLARPSVIIDINRLTEIAGIRLESGVLYIGAMTRHCEVAESPVVREHVPLLTQALRHVAHPAIRNRGTFGGSLVTADPSAELPACCVALGARIRVESAHGHRIIPADKFFRGIYETAREPDELLTGVEIPVAATGWRSCFIEFARRHGDYAVAGIAAQAKLENARFADIRIVLFGVEARPSRIDAAEKAIVNAASTEDGIGAAQAALIDALTPLSDNQASEELRLHYSRVLIRRAVLELTGSARVL